jgi:hypothetical protein
MSEQVRRVDNDQERWARIALYSDSTEPKDLSMMIVKNANLAMDLNAKRSTRFHRHEN